jgi:hypothetical protein
MKKTMKVAILLALALILSNGILAAKSTTEKSKLKFSFIERFRFTGWDNSINLDDQSAEAFAFNRTRTSIMAKWNPNSNIELGVKLTNEFRVYLTPKDREFDINEVVFDQLYLKWQNVGKMPLTLTIGRQNLIMGEGFVMMDGSPLDGSRTIYFNALRADYQLNKKHKLTAFYVYQPMTDKNLPVINDLEQGLIEQPEAGFGIYYTGLFNKTKLESYFIRKDIHDTESLPLESGINALGARITHPFTGQLSITTEGTIQFGETGEFDRNAFGGYFHLDYKMADTVPVLRKITLGGIYLSGDDPETEKIEGWDPLFSRWPKWSESYIYTQIREQSVAYWTNFNSIYLSALLDVSKNVNLTLTYHKMGANELNPNSFPGGAGKTRGDLLISRFDYKINSHTSGHFIWENFNPGSFYFSNADSYNWFRFELMFKF